MTTGSQRKNTMGKIENKEEVKKISGKKREGDKKICPFIIMIQ